MISRNFSMHQVFLSRSDHLILHFRRQTKISTMIMKGGMQRETDMDVDERRIPLYGRVKRELLKPELKDVDNVRGGVDMDATCTEAAVTKVKK
nr:PREDICTED: uncharacterized protein LOC108225547 isoform X2 [Daucus carota subsp. sativus]